MRAWLRVVGTADIPIASINKACHKRYSDIKKRTVTGATHVWGSITSAMSASILHLLQLEIRPISPTTWLRRRIEGDTTSGDVFMDMRCPIQREEHLQWIEDRLAEAMWSNVTEHEPTVGYGVVRPRSWNPPGRSTKSSWQKAASKKPWLLRHP